MIRLTAICINWKEDVREHPLMYSTAHKTAWLNLTLGEGQGLWTITFVLVHTGDPRDQAHGGETR
jgi:hypothetical protein